MLQPVWSGQCSRGYSRFALAYSRLSIAGTTDSEAIWKNRVQNRQAMIRNAMAKMGGKFPGGAGGGFLAAFPVVVSQVAAVFLVDSPAVF